MKKTIEFKTIEELISKAHTLQQMYEYGRKHILERINPDVFKPFGDDSFIANITDFERYESEIKEYQEYITQVHVSFKVKVINDDKGEA